MTFREAVAAFQPGCEQEAADQRLMLRYMDTFADVLTRENALAHATASAWIVTPDRAQVLMAYHNQYQSWAWLGGHADGKADLLQVALREVREESGLETVRAVQQTPVSLEILSVAAHKKRGVFVPAHLHLNLTYLLEADLDAPVRCKPDENSAVRWVLAQSVVQASTEAQMLPIYRKLLTRAAYL